MNFNILKQARIRGLIYAGIATLGICYELFFSAEVRPFLIVMYILVILIGIVYFRFAPKN